MTPLARLRRRVIGLVAGLASCAASGCSVGCGFEPAEHTTLSLVEQLIAFDIDASQFNSVREAGALLMAAGNAKELSDTLDGLLLGKILVEQ